MRLYLAILLLISSIYALDRNYYADEVKIVNHCYPSHMGLWGEEGTPERGWFEKIEECTGTGSMETYWHVKLFDNITAFTVDENSRVNGVLDGEFGNALFTPISPQKALNYSPQDSITYANGMQEVMANAMDGRVLVTAHGNCLNLYSEIMRNVTRNAINMYHFYYPSIRAKENKDGWCFVEP